MHVCDNANSCCSLGCCHSRMLHRRLQGILPSHHIETQFTQLLHKLWMLNIRLLIKTLISTGPFNSTWPFPSHRVYILIALVYKFVTCVPLTSLRPYSVQIRNRLGTSSNSAPPGPDSAEYRPSRRCGHILLSWLQQQILCVTL